MNQNRVLVLDTAKRPLMPCTPARARKLLKSGKAAVCRRFPFTIILKYEVEPNNQPVQIKIDPGSKTTGLALVAHYQRGKQVIWAAELEHRGEQIKARLLKRRQVRHSRRNRKTRYRPARFNNRRRKEGWLPPSIRSRVDNIQTWLDRLYRFTPYGGISLELVKFDTQKLQNPEISGVEYQQGELMGYEVREYLLEKWGRKCVYCGAENVPLEIEHITPKSRGGSSRVSNLTLACRPCNQEKNSQTAEEFGYPHIQAQATRPLKNAAAVNMARWALYRAIEQSGLPFETGTGGRTKYNRVRQGYPKAHWIDAACVGVSGEQVHLIPELVSLHIKAVGRQSRQMCRMDRYGFPRTTTKQSRVVCGFQTGDMVRAVVSKGKCAGTHTGRVAVRAKGSFAVGEVDGISWRYCRTLHRSDGYTY
jgi:5-methylcytosine-specific restriction endonuclease McrA